MMLPRNPSEPGRFLFSAAAISLFLLFLLPGGALSVGLPAGVLAGAEDPEEDPAEEVRRTLEETTVSLDLRDAGLTDFLDIIEAHLPFQIHRDRSIQEDLSPEERRVTISLSRVSAKAALKAVLEPIRAGVVFRDGVVTAATKREALETVRRVYNVQDLVFAVRDFPGPELGIGRGYPPGGMEFLERNRGRGNRRNSPLLRLSIVEFLQSHTGSRDLWEHDRTSILLSGGLLVVEQTGEVQQEVHRALHRLRWIR